LDLKTDAEYVANLMNVNMWLVVSVQQCSVLNGYAIPLPA